MINEEKRERLPALRKVNRRKLKEEVKKVNQVLEKVATKEITGTNTLIYAGAVIVAEKLGLRGRKATKRREPMWKRRLESQIKRMRFDLNRVEALLQGKTLKEHHNDETRRGGKKRKLKLHGEFVQLKYRV